MTHYDNDFIWMGQCIKTRGPPQVHPMATPYPGVPPSVSKFGVVRHDRQRILYSQSTQLPRQYRPGIKSHGAGRSLNRRRGKCQ